MRRAAPIRALFCGILLAAVIVPAAHSQRRYRSVRDAASPPEIPYTRYFTKDKFNRRITFYVHGDQSKRLPIVVSVLGSGAYSNFIRIDGQIRDGHRAAREAFDGRAHVVIVEKPGIQFLEQHGADGQPSGTEVGASPEFLRENTLDRWAEAVNAAMRAARSLSLADTSRTLLIGHSEGGQVVSLLAAENAFVTHVAVLSTTGPTMLFGFMLRAREGKLYPHLPPDPEKHVAQLLADIAEIYADPDSDEITFGHSHRYWASRWSSSPMELLPRTKARIFLARGSADGSEALINFDLVYANLLAKGKDVTAHLVEGADHGFQRTDQPERDGWKEIFEEVRDWFFR
jgi:pimeloyl-ACP methyl ester carboxylesterase